MATPEEHRKARKQSAYQQSGKKAFAKIAKGARATAAAKKILSLIQI